MCGVRLSGHVALQFGSQCSKEGREKSGENWCNRESSGQGYTAALQSQTIGQFSRLQPVFSSIRLLVQFLYFSPSHSFSLPQCTLQKYYLIKKLQKTYPTQHLYCFCLLLCDHILGSWGLVMLVYMQVHLIIAYFCITHKKQPEKRILTLHLLFTTANSWNDLS